MSTVLNTNGEELHVPELDKKARGKFYVITAEWNHHITHALRDGAIKVLEQAGVEEENIKLLSVPGAVELVNAAAMTLEAADTAAVIIIGCVIRGDTPHFDYVCNIASQGATMLNIKGKAPVIFGVLTVETLAQALERAGGTLGNKGAEAGVAAIEMANLHARFEYQIENVKAK